MFAYDIKISTEKIKFRIFIEFSQLLFHQHSVKIKQLLL